MSTPAKRTTLLAVICVLAAAGLVRAADIRGNHEDPNKEFGKDANYRLIGDATFGWRTAAVAGDIDLSGHAFVMDTGGGNYTVFSGAITGQGSFEWCSGGVPQVAPSVLSGDKPNTFQGTFTLSKGVLDLAKPAGVDSIPCDLILGTKGSAVIRLNKADQINDRANITLGGPGICGLELQGHDEKFASVTLATHADILMGEKPAALVVGDSSARSWDLTKTMTIRGFKPGKDKLVFGKDERGLSKGQLARIGFAAPEGLAEGLYTAKIGPDGALAPDALVKAVQPPFDVSPPAVAERAKLYDVPGLDTLCGSASPLKEGMTIDFFGDSITWQNGFIETIDKALQRGEGARGKTVKLVNRGINGGGVLQVRDGATNSAFPGNSAQQPFAAVIATDKADLAVVFIGINDVWWRKTAPDVFEQALRNIVASAKANNTLLVLATLSLRGELPDGKNGDDPKIEHYAKITRQVANETRTTLVDLRKACVAYLQNHNAQLRVDGTLYFQSSGVLTYDGVHPSSKGVALLANLISDGIRRALSGQTLPTSVPSPVQAGLFAPLKPGNRFDYSKYAFQPESWKKRGLSLLLTPWTGTNVIFLTTDDTLDPGLMGIWVSRLDAGWQMYADLTGRRPSPLRQFEGKVTIAAVPGYDLTCGAGCGYVGATGIELAMFYDHNYPELKTRPKAMPHYVFYEMGRNFYTFGDRLSCFITGFAVFMRYVCMDALQCEDADAQTRQVIEGVEPRFSASGLTFLDLFTTSTGVDEKVSRIKDGNGKLIEPSDQPVCYASAMLRLRRQNGGDAWVKRFFHELAACPTANPATKEGALKQSWYWLLCASLAAQKDLSPVFAGEWKLPLADDTRAALGRIDWKKQGLTLKDAMETVTPVWRSPDTIPATSRTEGAPPLIPLPKNLTLGRGLLTLTKAGRILATSQELAPLAKVLAEEVFLATGARLATASGQSEPGDVVLQLDPGLKGEAYSLEVKDRATVKGASYQGLASGTVTWLQLLRATNDMLTVQRVSIADEPAYPYRGALLDLARKYHSPGGLEQAIELCRLYKIRYLHLHLTDDQLFMFPSTQFPQLGQSNREFSRFEPASKPRITPYTLAELRALERFAQERGVYLVPEMDLPGHSGRLIADAQDVFGIPGNGSTVNIASPKTLQALTTLLNEVMDVFQSTPYVHLGADEVGLGGLDKTADYKAAQAKFGIRNVHDLYCKFITDLHAVVTKRGKKIIVWEEACNPGGAYPLPKDALVMVWSQGRNPNDLVKDGYAIVNATWTPLYIVRDNKKSLQFLFDWALPQFGREGSTDYTALNDTAKLMGTQLCSWENSEAIEIQSLRDRLALVAERAWNPQAGGTFAAFKSRLAHTDALLDRLVHPITIQAQGGFVQDENTFTEPLTLTLLSSRPRLTLKYTLDNSLPNERWQPYAGPITVDQTVHLRAGLFDDQGLQQGHLVGGWFRSQIPARPNLATGKPVTVGPSPDRTDGWFARLAVDGRADDPGGHWASEGPAPQWLQVDLEKVCPINFINLITYWDGGRYYQWNAALSVDGQNWKKVLDFSENRTPATAKGYSGRFPTLEARYVRINMLKNSANPFVHVVELIVDNTK
jgi:N-acetyl-beta-hexosaminidase/lysophospholipase L1-like esterase